MAIRFSALRPFPHPFVDHSRRIRMEYPFSLGIPLRYSFIALARIINLRVIQMLDEPKPVNHQQQPVRSDSRGRWDRGMEPIM